MAVKQWEQFEANRWSHICTEGTTCETTELLQPSTTLRPQLWLTKLVSHWHVCCVCTWRSHNAQIRPKAAYLAVGSSHQSPCRSHCCPPPGNWGSSRTCWRCHPTHAAECGPACAHGSPSLSPVHLQYQTTPREKHSRVIRENKKENNRHLTETGARHT